MEPIVFHVDRRRAVALAVAMGALTCACAAVVVLDDATIGERLSGAAAAAMFAWGFALGVARACDRRPAIMVDSWGVRDRRMRIAAPWSSIMGVGIWVQEADAARASWVVLRVDDPAEVRALPPLWARVRRATLERWGRPPTALNVLGLTATAADVAAAMRRFRPDLPIA